MVGAKELMISILFAIAVMAFLFVPRGGKPSLFKEFRENYKARQTQKQSVAPTPTSGSENSD